MLMMSYISVAEIFVKLEACYSIDYSLCYRSSHIDMHDLRSKLERIPGLRHPCDLDMLVFFYRHPAALLTSEQLVAIVGYERKRIATTLDGLIASGLLTRSANPSQAARRLYSLKLGGLPDDTLQELLEVAASRPGRLELIRLLRSGPISPPKPGSSNVDSPEKTAPHDESTDPKETQ